MYIFDIGSVSKNESFFRIEKHKNVQCLVHIHFCVELVFVYSGQLIMNVNDVDRVINAGCATFMMPFDRHSFFTPCDCTCIVIEFSPRLVEEFYEEIRNKKPEVEVFELDRSLVDFCVGLMPEDSSNELAVKAALYPLCCKVCEICRFEKGGKTFDDVFIDAIKYISDNFHDENVTLTSVANFVGVHHVYLSRIFSENAGMGFKKYINLLRCNAAAQRLRKETNKTISEIALECGFGSIRNFNRQFADLFGLSPLKYRKNEEP